MNKLINDTVKRRPMLDRRNREEMPAFINRYLGNMTVAVSRMSARGCCGRSFLRMAVTAGWSRGVCFRRRLGRGPRTAAKNRGSRNRCGHHRHQDGFKRLCHKYLGVKDIIPHLPCQATFPIIKVENYFDCARKGAISRKDSFGARRKPSFIILMASSFRP